ncbi:MAG: alpha/beta hydrolase [Siphonobacter sp.]
MKTGIILTGLIFRVLLLSAQSSIPYGNNPNTGRYHNVGDANLYYEIYGRGKPIVLLHGGLFGYIDEYEFLIPKLAEDHQVIAIATRGHGKSELGHKKFTYAQLAEDAYQVIRSITSDSVCVIGFSDGGIAGYNLAARHPELVRKLIAIGAPRRPADRTLSLQEEGKMTVEQLEKKYPDFVKSRRAIMPEPTRWAEFLDRLDEMWNLPTFITDRALQQLTCPVLVLAGDHDPYFRLEKLIETFRLLPKGQLACVPGCGHVVLYCNFPAVWEDISSFIN